MDRFERSSIMTFFRRYHAMQFSRTIVAHGKKEGFIYEISETVKKGSKYSKFEVSILTLSGEEAFSPQAFQTLIGAQEYLRDKLTKRRQ